MLERMGGIRPLEKRLETLNDDERRAYNTALLHDPLSPTKAAPMCRLYLQGYTTQEIAKLNPSMGTLGFPLIVRAKVDFDWQGQREMLGKNLMDGCRIAVEKTTLEAIRLATDGMAAFHLLVGDKFKKFLQSGNPDDLGEWKDFSFDKYRKMIELVVTLTGRAATLPQNHQVDVSVRVDNAKTVEGQRVTPTDAAQMIEMLLSEEKK